MSERSAEERIHAIERSLDAWSRNVTEVFPRFCAIEEDVKALKEDIKALKDIDARVKALEQAARRQAEPDDDDTMAIKEIRNRLALAALKYAAQANGIQIAAEALGIHIWPKEGGDAC